MRHGIYYGRTEPVGRADPHADEHGDDYADQHGNGYCHAERHANGHGNGHRHAERHANGHGNGYCHADADTYRDIAAHHPDAHAYVRVQPNVHQHTPWRRTSPANIYTSSAGDDAATAAAATGADTQ